MSNLQEPSRAGAFLLSEGNGEISRASVTLAALAVGLAAGQLLGIVTASKQYAAYDPAASNGTEKVAAVLYAARAESTDPQSAVAIVRLAEVSASRLIGLDADARADLAEKLIIVRD
ncbi:MAG: head decoration protein [Alcaligenaceae bacterium]|nr:head decoration protein [Alcaligenaceae bacterium SAGV5]MPS50448.1 head decoration protein [Alcaligenaceae bacterium SAGV3]MPT57891.1 head decoration protein [Alcaligenaceae bacterium]